MKIITISTALIFWTSVSWAQIAINHVSTVDIGGVLKLDITNEDIVSSDRALMRAETKMGSSLITEPHTIKPEKSMRIVRLDKGIYWQCYDIDKVFTEKPLSLLKNQPDPLGSGTRQKGEDEYRWEMKQSEIKPARNIAGFSCAGRVATATGVARNDIQDTVIVIYEQWKTTGLQSEAELAKFYDDYAAVVGTEQVWGQNGVDQMLRRYGTQFESLVNAMDKMEGYPIRTIIEIKAIPGGDLSKGNQPEKSVKQTPKQKPKKLQTTLKITNEVQSIRKAASGVDFFEVPAGYIPQ